MELAVPLSVLAWVLCSSPLTSVVSASSLNDSRTFISGIAGTDHPLCINNETNPCQSLEYALKNATSHNEFVILEDIYLGRIVTLSGISGLILRGLGEPRTTVNCTSVSTREGEGGGFEFVSVSDVQIVNLSLEGCGAQRPNTTATFRSAMYFLNCSGVVIHACEFHRSRGRALTFHDTGGDINITESVFADNVVSDSERQYYFAIGGGAIKIEYTQSSLEQRNSDSGHNFVVIDSCSFNRNSATDLITADTLFQFPRHTESDSNCKGQGGAIAIVFKGHSSDNSIAILNNTFSNNSAQCGGGGLEIFIGDSASGNSVTVNNSHFVWNTAQGGGAIELVGHSVNNNSLAVYNTEFVENSGWWGGAVAIWSRPTAHVGTTVVFANCTWSGNSASIGAALYVLAPHSKTIHSGTVYPNITLANCLFVNNKLKTHNFAKSGVLHVEDFAVICSGSTEFKDNTGSAIYASSAKIHVSSNATALFRNNTATRGGAMRLESLSTLKLSPNTTIKFESNSAEIGGALSCATEPQTDFFDSRKCFISYEYKGHPNDWITSLAFINNTAKYGSAIHIDSLIPCAKHDNGDIIKTLRWKSFKYTPNSEEYTITTDPATISFHLPAEISPGETVPIHPLALDDLNQTSLAVYQATAKSQSTDVEVGKYIGGDGHLHITKGTPGSDFTLTLETLGARRVSFRQNGALSKCPIGFTLESGRCVCSGHDLVGITKCKEDVFKSYLEVGFWAGCDDDDTLLTADCPTGYCRLLSHITDLTPLSRSCRGISQQSVCTANRTGRLCGECVDGYSVFYHAEFFSCEECTDGALGLLIYAATELLPLCLFFIIIILLQINLSSGSGQSFTFFVQVALLLSYKPIPHEKDYRSTHVLTSAFYFVFGPLNLDFFKTDATSFCLWNGATALDILAFKYVTLVAGITLLSALVCFFRWRSLEAVSAKLFCCCPRVKLCTKEHFSKAKPVLHIIATFMVIFYDRITVTSFQILARVQLYGEDGASVTSVVALSGGVEYFGGTHLLYALPALLVLLLFTAPPPLILIAYPLLWKRRCNCSSMPAGKYGKTCWPVRKLLPLIDFFQEGYRDGYRFFSGFTFLWRVFITAIVAFTCHGTYYLLISTVLVTELFVYGITTPHRSRFNNRMDMLVITTLLMINMLDWFKYINTVAYQHLAIEISAHIKVLLLYLPISLLCVRFIRKQGQKLKVQRLCKDLVNVIRAFLQEQCVKRAEGQSDLSPLQVHGECDTDLPLDSASFCEYM